jgi:glycosyltransferase involved in cell wall biosynthesis
MKDASPSVPRRLHNPLVSIVMTIYNEAYCVEHAIDTLLAQTYRHIELVLVDNGSSDSTFKVLSQYARGKKRDARVRVVRMKKNTGPGGGRNKGAKAARGDILVFIDADMVFDKRYISVLVKPIVDGKAFGTTHTKELCANKGNLWARSWSLNRVTPESQRNGCGVYRAILRSTFLKAGGFDPSKGYFDDDLSRLGNAKPVPAICYHNNPEKLDEIFLYALWVGRSLVSNPSTRYPMTAFLVGSFAVCIAALTALAFGASWPLSIIVALCMLVWLSVSLQRAIPRIVAEGRYEYLFSIPVIWLFRLVGHYLGGLQQIWKMMLQR